MGGALGSGPRENAARPGRLVIPDNAVLDARQLAQLVNDAGKQGFVFDGIDLRGAV